MSTLGNILEWFIPHLFATIGISIQRVAPNKDANLREWSPPPSPPPTPVKLHDRGPSKYSTRKNKKKKVYKSRYDIDIDALEDDEDETNKVSDISKHSRKQTNGILSMLFCCRSSSSVVIVEPSSSSKKEPTSTIPIEEEPLRPKSKYSILRQHLHADEEGSEEKSLVHKFFGENEDDETVLEDEETIASADHSDKKNEKRQLTDEERAVIERRKAKQAKRLRKKVEKKETEEFVEKVIEEYDPLERYNANFPSFGRLKGMPMSLDFMNSSHAKRAYDVVVSRKTNRLNAMKEFVKNGGIDTIALNSGPDDKFVPPGFYISPRIPNLDMSFNGELAMILWEMEMNVDQFKQGDPALGWFVAKVHSHCNRPPYNFIMKYSKEVTGLRKLDGFVNTTLDPAGINGYGRRWVWIRPSNSRPSSDMVENHPSDNQDSFVQRLLSSSNSIDHEGNSGSDNAQKLNVRSDESSQQFIENGYGSKVGTKENGGDDFNTNDRIE